MTIKCILFLIPYRMYSGLEEIQSQLEDAGFFCHEFFIMIDASEDPYHCDILKGIFDEYDDNIIAVVYPSSSSYIYNSDWSDWQYIVNGKRNINRYLEFFSNRDIKLIDCYMSEMGVFDDTLGFYGDQKDPANMILKEIRK